MTADTSDRIGKFRVLARLGQGGMAEVFKCDVTGVGGFNKTLVVKRILEEYEQEETYVQMFLKEARIQALLNHANVVQVFEVGLSAGRPFMAMEFANGPTLRQIIRVAHRRKRVHFGHMARIASNIAAGLEYCHNAKTADGNPLNLIHRDVTPHNIIVTMEGVPKLLDFGVAKADVESELTRDGEVKGKLAYLAPEQINGEPASPLSDVYSLGMTLYIATVGRPPFAGSTAATMLRDALAGALDSPAARVREYPPELEEAVMTALAADPAQRCPSAAVLHDRLEQFLTRAGPHQSTTGSFAGWLRDLFPTEEHYKRGAARAYASAGDDSYTSNSSIGSMTTSRRELQKASEEQQSIVRRRRRLPLVIGAALVVAGGLAVGVARLPVEGAVDPARPPPAESPARDAIPTEPDASPIEASVDAPEISLDEIDEAAAIEVDAAPLRPKRKPRKRRTKAQAGRIVVQSSPAGVIYLDGVAIGQAPKTITKVPTGEHIVQIRREGYEDAVLGVHVMPRRLARVNLTLTERRSASAAVKTPLLQTPPLPADTAPAVARAPQPKPQSSEFPAPRLPASQSITDAREMIRVFRMVEEEVAVHSGVPDVARNMTLALGKALGKQLGSSEVEIYPRAMYYLAMKQLEKGASTEEVAEALKSAHFSGRLAR